MQGWRPEMQKRGGPASGRRLGAAARDAKNEGRLADVKGWRSEMQKMEGVWRMFRVGGPRCKKWTPGAGCLRLAVRNANIFSFSLKNALSREAS